MENIAIIEEVVKNFFEKLMIKIENIEISLERENIYFIKISTEESWIVIWASGANLTNIKTLLGLMISKKLNNNTILHLEINDYLEKKDEKLYNFIKSKIYLVRDTGREIKLPFFTSYERKKIHSYVNESWSKDIYTKSIWEWRDRRLYICKKDTRVSIDIDWVDI